MRVIDLDGAVTFLTPGVTVQLCRRAKKPRTKIWCGFFVTARRSVTGRQAGLSGNFGLRSNQLQPEPAERSRRSSVAVKA